MVFYGRAIPDLFHHVSTILLAFFCSYIPLYETRFADIKTGNGDFQSKLFLESTATSELPECIGRNRTKASQNNDYFMKKKFCGLFAQVTDSCQSYQ